MRFWTLPLLAWAVALQSVAIPATIPDTARLIGTAGVLGSLTVLVYRLGVWRQEMENTKNNVGAEVRSHREESASNFARIERQLEALDHVLTDYMEFKQQAGRRHHRTVRRIERLEKRH